MEYLSAANKESIIHHGYLRNSTKYSCGIQISIGRFPAERRGACLLLDDMQVFYSRRRNHEGTIFISASTKTIPRPDTCIVYAQSILIYSSNSAIQTGRRKGGIYGQTEIIWEHLKDRSSGHFCGHVHCQIHRQHRKIKDCRCITLLQCSTL